MSSAEQLAVPKKQMLIAIGVIILLIILSVFWIMQSTRTENNPNQLNQQEQQLNQSADENHIPLIKILLIKKTGCENCISLDFLVQEIKTGFDLNVIEVKEVDADSEEGKNLIAMHEITLLPSMIINGEFQGTQLQELWPNIGEEINGVLVLRQLEPPYYSVEEDRLVGKVNYILIKKSDCEECEGLSLFSDYIEDLNVFLETKTELEYDSPEAQKLIQEYFIERIPAVILTGEPFEYELFSYIWSQGGGFTDAEAYTYEEAVPFYDLTDKKVKGLVEVTRLTDSNCLDCIDSNALVAPLIDQLKMKIVKDATIDFSSAEGKQLIEKYSITKIPSIIVSQEAEEYLEFVYAWDTVGTQEPDGVFVFRNLNLVEGNYTDLNHTD